MATSNNQTGFSVGADINPFEAAMRRMVDAAKKGEGGVGTALAGIAGGPLAGLKVAFAALSATLAGLGLAKVVSDTNAMTESAMDLSRALGITTNAARAVNLMLEDVGATTGDYEAAGKGMLKQLKQNEDQMQAMGLATRDAAGNLRPMNDLILDGIKVLGTYAEGTDRNLASTVLFGKGIDGSSKLMLLNREAMAEATATMKEMGLEVGENAVAAWKAFDAAQDKVGFGLQGLKKAVADALLPVMTTLSEMLGAVLPAAIVVIRGALAGLTAAFLFVRNGVVVLWEVINAMVISVAEPLKSLATGIYQALTGDFEGARNTMMSIGDRISAAWGNAMDNMAASSAKTAAQVKALFSEDIGVGAGGGVSSGNKKFTPKEKKQSEAKKETEVAEESQMGLFGNMLIQRKLAFEQENTLREFGKREELAYWQDIVATYELGSKDRTAVASKMLRLELDLLREGAKQKRQIEDMKSEEIKVQTLDYVAELEARAAFELDQGQITATQYLAQRQQFNALRLQAEQAFIDQKIELAKLDPENNLVLLEQLEIQKRELKRKFQAEETELKRQTIVAEQSDFKGMLTTLEGAWGNTLKGLLTGSQTIGQSIKGLFSAVGDAVMGMLAKIAAEWMVKQVAMKLFGKALSLGKIGEESAKAGAGGVASMAAAPFPLNLSAPAFGAAMAAAAMSFAPLASASQGFDIPSGLNPITQLHQEEMVLPAHIANPLRENLAAGGGMGAPRQSEGQIRGMPPSEWLMVHRADLVSALKSSQRDFAFTKF